MPVRNEQMFSPADVPRRRELPASPLSEKERIDMVPILRYPDPVDVRCGWLDGRPREVRMGGQTLPVLAISRIRREVAAYPALTGPRTCYEVVTRAARLSLVFRHRERRWMLERYEPRSVVAARAA
jgi:hypothetical protein